MSTEYALWIKMSEQDDGTWVDGESQLMSCTKEESRFTREELIRSIDFILTDCDAEAEFRTEVKKVMTNET